MLYLPVARELRIKKSMNFGGLLSELIQLFSFLFPAKIWIQFLSILNLRIFWFSTNVNGLKGSLTFAHIFCLAMAHVAVVHINCCSHGPCHAIIYVSNSLCAMRSTVWSPAWSIRATTHCSKYFFGSFLNKLICHFNLNKIILNINQFLVFIIIWKMPQIFLRIVLWRHSTNYTIIINNILSLIENI